MTDEVHTERFDRVLVITINRPEAKNSINRAASEQIAAAVDRLDAMDDLAVGVLTGANGTFSAGLDLKAYLRGEDMELPGRGMGGIIKTSPRKPLIAAVEGWALAGGCELMLACDLVVAGQGALFGIPEVKVGLAAGGGGLLRLARRVSPAVAMELALTGDPIDAKRAYAVGLINKIVPDGTTVTAARELAQHIARNSPLGLVISKQILTTLADLPLSDAFAAQEPLMDVLLRSEDSREGARAFTEKRPPSWVGR